MKIMGLALLTLISMGTMAAFETKAQETNVMSQEETSKKFIEDVGNQVVTILVNKSVPLSSRQASFRQILENNFDIPKIGKFILGRYWRQASLEQQAKYLRLFEDTLVESYSKQFENYHNEKLEVKSVRKLNDGGTIVTSKIIRTTGAPPLQVDWKVYNTSAGMHIFDIIINGVSMSITYRTEYADILSSQGGTIEGLLQIMERKKVINVDIPEDKQT